MLDVFIAASGFLHQVASFMLVKLAYIATMQYFKSCPRAPKPKIL
jgi:hypothetical protein